MVLLTLSGSSLSTSSTVVALPHVTYMVNFGRRRSGRLLNDISLVAGFVVHHNFVASIIISSPNYFVYSNNHGLLLSLSLSLHRYAHCGRHGGLLYWFMMPVRSSIPDSFPCLASSAQRIVFIVCDNVFFSTETSSTSASTASPTSSLQTRLCQNRSMP
jgi:hypothetical protein